MKSKQGLWFVALALCAQMVSAQWLWLDNDGRKVFSDRAPPPEIPDKNILKQPNRVKPTAPAIAQAASAPASAASAAKAVGKDPVLEARKKQIEQDEKAKAQAEKEKVAQVKAQNCLEAKRGLQTLQSGVRMQQINAKGEPEILDDAGRAAEMKRVQVMIDTQCE